MSAMKCLLIQSPYIHHYKGVEELSKPMLPIGLASIAAVLREDGFDVSIIDPNIESDFNDIIHYIKRERIDLVGISAMTSSISSAQVLARMIKAHTTTPIVIGGVHASALKEETMKQTQDFDYLVFGEGEYTMLELCQNIRSGSCNFSEIKGLGYRKNGQILFNEPRQLIQDLDLLPFPARDLCKLERYEIPAYLRVKECSAHLITSRGCPYRCTFCSGHTVTGYKFRHHSAERIVAEIEKLMKDYGVRFFMIYDDTFLILRERVVDFCKLIIKRKIKIKWFCMARVDIIDDEIIGLMYRAGMRAINFGVESGDEKVLRRIKKGITLDTSRRAFKIVRQYKDLRVFSSFMIGLPKETHLSIQKTIDFAIELDPDMAFFFIFTPYPGTEIYENCKGIDFDVSDNWERFNHVFTDSPLVLRNKEFSEQQLKHLLVTANRRFYLRPKHILRDIRRIRSFEEIYYRAKGLIPFIKQNFKISGVFSKSNSLH